MVLDEVRTDAEPPDRVLGSRAHNTWSPLTRALAATGDRWTLMIAAALTTRRMRLSDLQRDLPGVSAGVLARHVQQMVWLGLLTRTRFKEMPPRVELELTAAGRELLPVIGALGRWGACNLWSPPTGREQVDLDALLRLLPLLAQETSLPGGSLEAIVEDGDPPFRRHYRVVRGRLQMAYAAEQQEVELSSSVRGTSAAWIAALAPAGDCTGLHVEGDQRLARDVLCVLGGRQRQGLPQWAP